MDQTAIKKAFRYNAAFSGLSGGLGAAFSGMLADWFGGPAWLFVALGVGLMGFSLQLLLLARGPEVSCRDAILVIASDAAWIVACVDLVVFGVVSGRMPVALTLGSCLFVGAFTWMQVRATLVGGSLHSS